MTRNIAAHLEMSLDGVVGEPERWAHEYFSPELLQAAQAGMQRTDTMLLGRQTYEHFAAAWPNQPQDDPFTQFMNSTPKVVVSTTLKDPSWGPVEVISNIDAVAELKAKPGGDVIVLGSPTLVESLLREGLIDTLELFVIPVLLGEGKRLFDGPERATLELIESKPMDKGVLAVRYAPAGKE